MESRVSSNCTRNIHWPPTAEKEVNRKGNALWKIAKRRQSLKFAGPLNLVPFLVPVDKKNHRTKFEIEEENTKLQIARKLPLQPLFFWLLKDRQDNFEKFHWRKLKKIKGKAKLIISGFDKLVNLICFYWPSNRDMKNI